jgi:predicted transcriptional regulator
MDKMTLSFKVDPTMKKALQDLAEKENRSLSNYVITLLLKHLDDKGIDWRQEKPDKKPKK